MISERYINEDNTAKESVIRRSVYKQLIHISAPTFLRPVDMARNGRNNPASIVSANIINGAVSKQKSTWIKSRAKAWQR